MNVLQICHKPPFPALDGGCLAMHDISNGLIKAGIQLKILSLATSKHPFQKEKLSDNYLRNTKIESIEINTNLKAKDAFFNLFSKKSYNVNRFYSPNFADKIKSVLKNQTFEIIHLESLFVLPYLNIIRENTSAKIVYRAHNVEQQIWKEKFLQCAQPLKKAYLKLLFNRLKDFEDKQLQLVDGIATISKNDLEQFKKLGIKVPMVNIPFSINPEIYYPFKENHSKDIFFIGSLDWHPNQEGLDWFLNNCWPDLKSKFPTLQFHIAGKGMPKKYKEINDKNIHIHGEVSSAMEFIKNGGIMVVPLFSGSGIRIKVLEGMALGKLIVSTSKGVEGIKVSENELLVADSKVDFIDSISKIIEDKVDRNKLSLNARKFVQQHFNNEKIINELISFYKSLN